MGQPRIAAIVCTYNREKYIGKALDALSKQDLPYQDFEVVVVDNNSTDRSVEVVTAFIESCPEMNLTLVHETNQGLSHARNRGIAEAQAPILTFLDDDALAEPNFLRKNLEYLDQRPELDAIGGKIIPGFVDGKPEWYTKYYWGVTGQFDPGEKDGPLLFWGKFPCGSNMTYHRRFFDTYGVFNTNLGRKGAILLAGEEKELFGRVKGHEKMMRVWYYPDLVVHHLVDKHKLNPTYLKKFSFGFAKGEKLEVAELPFLPKLKRYLEFTAKSAGTLLLALGYLLRGEPAKASMIVKFGWWIFQGFWLKA